MPNWRGDFTPINERFRTCSYGKQEKVDAMWREIDRQGGVQAYEYSFLNGALCPKPRCSAGQSPATLPSGRARHPHFFSLISLLLRRWLFL